MTLTTRLQLTAAIFYPLALLFGGEALVSIKRIEEFLLLAERTPMLDRQSFALQRVLTNENNPITEQLLTNGR